MCRAMIVFAALALVGLGIAIRLPANPRQAADSDPVRPAAVAGALDTAV
jgi:hypothetical protein